MDPELIRRVEALRRPLELAAKDNFAGVRKIAGLGIALRAACDGVIAKAPPSVPIEALAAWRESLGRWEQLPEDQQAVEVARGMRLVARFPVPRRAPVLREGSVLVDGGLVNPVPVSLARAMGADVLIAVDLSSDILGRHRRAGPQPKAPAGDVGDLIRKLQDNLGALIPAHSADEPRMPSMLDVLTSSINIMQVRITRSRMAGEPPDLIVAPRLAHLGLLDFHRAKEAIEEGKRAVERVAHSLPALNNQAL